MTDVTANDPRPVWAPAISGLWQRTTGDAFPIRSMTLSGEPRRFTVEAIDGTLQIAATDAVAAAVGIRRYLADACGFAASWGSNSPVELSELPAVGQLHGVARVDEFYYLNFCTFSYSTAYWAWEEWEREIDWMALHGVTVPLQLVGHEAVLQRVYTEHGMSDAQIRAFLGGPGYLPFVYMGCLDSFGGPLPEGWVADHEDLGRRILERQRSLGMRPVLPAFTGHLPRELAPSGSKSRTWQGLQTTVVAPEHPLFRSLTSSIVRAQRELFGTDHLYASDPFIEMVPADTDADGGYPAAVADAIVAGIGDADQSGVWVLQSWPFSYQGDYWNRDRVAAFLDRVPADRLLMLDLWAEADPQWQRLDGFAGRPWVWNGLLNFGGRSDAIADLTTTAEHLERALESNAPPVGLGLTMEAIHNNPAFFELVADRAWTASEPETLDAWLQRFGRNRYGTDDALVDSAWSALGRSLLAADSRSIFPELFISVAVTPPSFALLAPEAAIRGDIERAVFYNPADVVAAASDLIGARGRVRDDELLADDVVTTSAALLVRLIDRAFSGILDRAARGEAPDGRSAANFLTLFDELDALVATRPTMRLDSWVSAARQWGHDPAGTAVLEDNARRMLTVWNSSENPHLDNYAARLWSGLVGDYSRRRWELWLDLLPDALDPRLRDAAQSQLDARLAELADAFIAEGPRGTAKPAEPGDAFTVATSILDRFGGEFLRLTTLQHP